MSDTYEEDDYIDPEQQAADDNGRSHLVFKDEIRVRYPSKGDDDKTILYVQPTFAVPITDDLERYGVYRRPPTDPEFPNKFTNWIRGYFVYEYVGGKVSILDPRTTNPEARVNPVQILLDTIMQNPDWRYLAGKTPDGKKMKDKKQWMESKVIDRAAMKYCFNAVNRSKIEEKEHNLACVYVVARGAVAGSARRGKSSNWGLFSKLNELARGVKPEDIEADFTRKWHWGDITSPRAQVPVIITKDEPPTGGSAKIWNMVPYGDGEVLQVPYINGGYPWLNTRAPLSISSQIFVDYDAKEVMEVLIDLFAAHGKILIKAFESTIPGFKENLLRATGVISSSVQHQAGVGPSPNSPPPGQSPPPPAAGQYAPKAAGGPPPPASKPAVIKYWLGANGKTVEAVAADIQALVDQGQNPSIMSYDQQGGWKKALDAGYSPTSPPVQQAPPPPPEATAPPPPPEAPVTPPPTAPAPPPAPPAANVPPDKPAAAATATPPPPDKPASSSSISLGAAELAAQLEGEVAGPGPVTPSGGPPPPPPGVGI